MVCGDPIDKIVPGRFEVFHPGAHGPNLGTKLLPFLIIFPFYTRSTQTACQPGFFQSVQEQNVDVPDLQNWYLTLAPAIRLQPTPKARETSLISFPPELVTVFTSVLFFNFLLFIMRVN